MQSWSSCSLLQIGLEICERRDAVLRVLVDPAVVDEPDRNRVQVVQLGPALAARIHEPRLLEHAEVLHDAESRHLELRLELRERAAVALEEPVEEMASRRVRQ